MYCEGLNALTIHYPCPLPLVPATLKQLRGAQVFTKLDLRSVYNSIRIKEWEEWNITPLKATMSTSKDLMDKYVMAYIKDILIYFSSYKEHINHVCTVLSHLLQHHYMSKQKCYLQSRGGNGSGQSSSCHGMAQTQHCQRTAMLFGVCKLLQTFPT